MFVITRAEFGTGLIIVVKKKTQKVTVAKNTGHHMMACSKSTRVSNLQPLCLYYTVM